MSIITISREYGSGGHSIGQRVAQDLGIEFYDKDIIRDTVRDSGLDSSVIEHEEEEISRADAIWRWITPAAYVDRREAIHEIERRVILMLASKGPCVILGRCADAILEDANIESLNVCASSTPGAHKYTITANCDLVMAKMLTAQIEKKIDVLQANFFTDEEIFINETCLLKISTPVMLENKSVCRMVRLHGAHIVEVNPTYATIEKTGITSDILSLYDSLKALGCVLQFVRSGRIAITKDFTEHLDEYLAEREKKRK